MVQVGLRIAVDPAFGDQSPAIAERVEEYLKAWGLSLRDTIETPSKRAVQDAVSRSVQLMFGYRPLVKVTVHPRNGFNVEVRPMPGKPPKWVQ